MPAPTFPLRFPKLQPVEVVAVKLPDGTIVYRTREELEKAKQDTPQKGGAG
jgi:hypothetical protein